MTYKEFVETIVLKIRDFLPEDYSDADVKKETVIKANDIEMTGINIRKKDSNIAPIIYLGDYYEDYKNGIGFEAILSDISNLRVSCEDEFRIKSKDASPSQIPSCFNIDFIKEFENVKNRITAKLINAEANERYLNDKPHLLVQNLAVTYHIKLNEPNESAISTVINNNLFKSWDISLETLHEAAILNMTKDVSLMPLTDVISSLIPENDALIHSDTKSTESIYVLTNQNKCYGASLILNSDIMDSVAERIGKSFFILPSSIHEVLLIPVKITIGPSDLQQMVYDINRAQVEPQDRLSDNVYVYDFDLHEIKIAA